MIQFIIPDDWEPLYNKLVTLMIYSGLDATKDCTKGCDGKHLKLIECWNIFQSACCARYFNLAKEQEFLYKFVEEQIKLTYGDYIPNYEGIQYATDKDIDDLIEGKPIDDNTPDNKGFEYATDDDIDNITNG